MKDFIKNKKVLIAILGIIGIVLVTVGATYAWFSYAKTGTKENTITSGAIKFHYQESSQGLSVDDMMPMTDDEGKGQNKYFDFTITSSTSRTVDIPYYITVRKTDSSYAGLDNYIKVYLTKVDDNGGESQVALSTFGALNHYTNDEISIPQTEKSLYNDTVLAGSSNYSQKYRLRMWIANNINMSPQTQYKCSGEVVEYNSAAYTACDSSNLTREQVYPYEGKTYSLKVNVYGEGNDIGESEATSRANTNIEEISFADSGDDFTLENGVYTSEMMMPEGETSMTKTIVIETENPNATVTVQKVQSPTSMNIEESKTKKLSTSVQLENLTVGENNYIITVIGADGRTTNQYNLSITVEAFNAFANDTWATIQYNVTHDNINRYNIGDTKTITLGNDLGTHKVRVANKTACTTETSTTACGFVVEFVDIINNYKMCSSKLTNVGGYPSTNLMYNYVTNTIYNSLPSDLRAVMINTTVISGHGDGSDKTCDIELENRDNDCNYITTDKIYLLSIAEVLPNYSSRESSASTTRQLDYYRDSNNSKIKTYKIDGVDTNYSWWLRSADIQTSNKFNTIGNTGSWDSTYSNPQYFSNSAKSPGVSPAFRIG